MNQLELLAFSFQALQLCNKVNLSHRNMLSCSKAVIFVLVLNQLPLCLLRRRQCK